MKHTQGKWTATKWAPGWSISSDDQHYTVANLSNCNNAEANARLIAAAPELLEALEALVMSLDPDKLSKMAEQTGYTVELFLIARESARAAIAKAKGE